MKEVNRKLLVIAVALMVAAMLATPMVVAKPGEEKSNEKFVDFELRLIGGGDPETGEQWWTPPSVELEDANTNHIRDREWVTTDITLTVGAEVYTYSSDPVYLGYYGTMDIDTVFREDLGNVQHIRVTETITFYDEGVPIGTLEIDVRDMITPKGVSGTFVAHGTGALKGVQVTGTDSIEAPPVTIVRRGQVMDWPSLP